MFNCQLFRDLSVEVSQTYWLHTHSRDPLSLWEVNKHHQTTMLVHGTILDTWRYTQLIWVWSGRRMCELCLEMKGNIRESNLSLWSPHRPVIICPADVCPDQQAARPRTAAPHPGFAQSQTRSVCGAQSHRAPELPQPLSEIGRTPADTLSIHIYFTSCVNKPGEQHWKKSTFAGKQKENRLRNHLRNVKRNLFIHAAKPRQQLKPKKIEKWTCQTRSFSCWRFCITRSGQS